MTKSLGSESGRRKPEAEITLVIYVPITAVSTVNA